MSTIDRRSFLQSLGVLVPGTVLGGLAVPDTVEAASPSLDHALMVALAEAVLPAELGSDGQQLVVAGFQEWLAGFEPVAELNHGYGTGEIEYAVADPGPGWNAQLRALDLQAKRTAGKAFTELAPEQRRELVRSVVARDATGGLPEIASARHVALGLLAYFYSTPEATDLCYRAEVGKNNCRPLSRNPERPAPLQPHG